MAHSFRSGNQSGRAAKGRFGPFAKPPVYARYLRTADVANRGLGRLNWADSALTSVAQGRTGVRA